jgi:hypothetical protein
MGLIRPYLKFKDMSAKSGCALSTRFEPNLFHILHDPDCVAILVGIEGVAIFVADCVIRFGTGQCHCTVTGNTVNCGAVAAVTVSLSWKSTALVACQTKLTVD